MDFNVSHEQRKVVDKAEKVATECLAPRADKYDREATHPRESWQDVWENGLLAMAVPREYGGLGLDMLTYCMSVEKLAGACTNTAMTVHMHSTVMRFIEALGSPRQKSDFYPEIVEEGKLFGSWGSEPESRGGTAFRHTAIAPRDGDYVINGVKHFCTMAGGAHRYMVHCTLEGAPPEDSLLQALVPHDNAGLRVLDEWNTLGMRGTVSPSVALEDCTVGEGDVLGTPGQSRRLGVGLAFGLGYAAIYLGAGQAALDFTREYSQTHRFDPDPALLSESLVVQRSVAEMAMALEGARLVLYQAASQWDGATVGERSLLAARAKYLTTQAALQVTDQAIQCVGGRSAHKRMPLERLFRDVRTCTLMPPNVDRTMEIIGRAELDVPDTFVQA